MFKIINKIDGDCKTCDERTFTILCLQCNQEIKIYQKDISFYIVKSDTKDQHENEAIEWIREMVLSKSQFRRYKIMNGIPII